MTIEENAQNVVLKQSKVCQEVGTQFVRIVALKTLVVRIKFYYCYNIYNNNKGYNY